MSSSERETRRADAAAFLAGEARRDEGALRLSLRLRRARLDVKRSRCSDCDGTGYGREWPGIMRRCPTCEGSGSVCSDPRAHNVNGCECTKRS